MLAHVARVTRTYRTHILWHSEEEAWKRKSRPIRAYSSPAAVIPLKHNAFDPLAQFAAQRLSEMLETARQLKDISESLLLQQDHSAAPPSQEQPDLPSPAPFQQQLKELVAGYNQLFLASDNSYGTINDQAAKTVLGALPSDSLEQLGIRPDSHGLLQLEEPKEDSPTIQAEHASFVLGLRSIASAIAEAADRMLALPPEHLLNRQEPPLQAYSKYRYQRWDEHRIYTYFPVPLTGFLLNQYL